MSAGDGGAFRARRYLVLRQAVAVRVRSFLHDYALKSLAIGKFKGGDASLAATPCAYADPFMEWLLDEMRPVVEGSAGVPVEPTYSYLRVYRRGDVLSPHTDRPSCQTSLTVNLGGDSTEPWPIWLEVDGHPQSIALAAGDALIYRGIELPHWREPLLGGYAVQVFLHYVDQDGPYSDWRFDRRAGLAIPALTRQMMEGITRADSR